MSGGIIGSRRSNGWKIELERYRNGDGIPFAKHPVTGSYMRTRGIPLT
jgi:hypothetical protein